MATLKEWLNEAGFNWQEGRILLQETEKGRSPSWTDAINASFISPDCPILTKSFNDSFGSGNAPAIIAEDALKIYYIHEYDGSTSLHWIYKDLNHYLNPQHSVPY